MKYLLLLLCLIFSGITFAQDAIYERTVHVYMTRDGDSYMVSNVVQASDSTIIALPYAQSYAVRLFGVDTPENSNPYVSAQQPYATESGAIVRSLITGQRVRLDSVATDQYGRMVARVLLKDGRDLAKVVAAEGLGWSYFVNYPPKPSDFLKGYRADIEGLQKIAREKRKGLFSLPRRTWLHPSTWRKRNPGG